MYYHTYIGRIDAATTLFSLRFCYNKALFSSLAKCFWILGGSKQGLNKHFVGVWCMCDVMLLYSYFICYICRHCVLLLSYADCNE